MNDQKGILTVAELAERWSVSASTVRRRVEEVSNPVPFFVLGFTVAQKARRELMRFRLVDIERWEQAQVQIVARPEVKETPGRPIGYDGPDYIGDKIRRMEARRAKAAGRQG